MLPEHPGRLTSMVTTGRTIPVPPSAMLHWFAMIRPGQHRSTPECTSTLNVGASSRRWREATIAAAESAADVAAMLTTKLPPAGSDESVATADAMKPWTNVEFIKRMMMIAPMGWDVTQMKGEHPNATYADFNRAQITEQARPLSMPYNAAACDSSTYSFASGKLDTLGYRAALNVERSDCNDLVLDPMFREWFREWVISDFDRPPIPKHSWVWPRHPVIDALQEAEATDKKLKNGTMTLSSAYDEDGIDFEDELVALAEDTFGDSTDESVSKMRKILTLKNTPSHCIQQVAALLGIEAVAIPSNNFAPASEPELEPAIP